MGTEPMFFTNHELATKEEENYHTRKQKKPYQNYKKNKPPKKLSKEEDIISDELEKAKAIGAKQTINSKRKGTEVGVRLSSPVVDKREWGFIKKL